MWVMNENCPLCGLDFDRGEPGYFTGAMYVSYGMAIPLIALLTLIEYLFFRTGRCFGWWLWPGAHLLAFDSLDLAIFAGDLDPFRPVFRPRGLRLRVHRVEKRILNA